MHSLSIDAENIDRLTISAPEGPASLLDLSYFDLERQEVPIRDFPHIVDVEPRAAARPLSSERDGRGPHRVDVIGEDRQDAGRAPSRRRPASTWEPRSPFPRSPGSKLTAVVRPQAHGEGRGHVVGRHRRLTGATRDAGDHDAAQSDVEPAERVPRGDQPGVVPDAPAAARPAADGPPHVCPGTPLHRGDPGVPVDRLAPRGCERSPSKPRSTPGTFRRTSDIEEPEEEYDESEETFAVTAFADNGTFSGDCTDINHEYTVQSPWVVDSRKGDLPDHPGVSMIADNNNGQANDSPGELQLREDWRRGGGGHRADLRRGVAGGQGALQPHVHGLHASAEPKPLSGGPSVVTPFLITSRSLCVRVRSGDPCPRSSAAAALPAVPAGDWVVSEDPVKVATAMLRRHVTTGGRTPVLKELLREIQRQDGDELAAGTRYPNGDISFLDTSYFADRIERHASPWRSWNGPCAIYRDAGVGRSTARADPGRRGARPPSGRARPAHRHGHRRGRAGRRRMLAGAARQK